MLMAFRPNFLRWSYGGDLCFGASYLANLWGVGGVESRLSKIFFTYRPNSGHKKTKPYT